MAHLICLSDRRRVLRFEDKDGHTVVIHREDGTDCQSEFVRIGRFTYAPHDEPLVDQVALGVYHATAVLGRLVAVTDLEAQGKALIKMNLQKAERRKRRAQRWGHAITDLGESMKSATAALEILNGQLNKKN
jgi:hypothetical protein